jgi:hypothetical protein
VAAVYSRAAYVELPGGVFALTAPDVPYGPLHARLPVAFDLEAESPVTVDGGFLDIGGRTVRFAGTAIWRGSLPEPEALAAAAPLAGEVLRRASPSALMEEPWRAALARAVACLEAGDLFGAAAALGGAGPGLTPAGDDALAGILIAARARGGYAVEEEVIEAAGAARTSVLAGAFVRWAARGQSIAPVHDLLGALAAGDCGAAEAARDELCALGSSSGADLALGLRLGLCKA